MRQVKHICALAAFTALAACATLPVEADTPAQFANDAVGSWTSVTQSADPDYDWVESEIVRVLPERTGVWLYQENAILGASGDDAGPEAAARKAAPYFQVVVHLQPMRDGGLSTTTFKIADRAAARSAWQDASAFDPAWIGEESCNGRVERIGEGFWQGTASCPNSYKGAVRMVSKSVRAPGMAVNWDRGFDADGNVVWGPVEGGYIFERKEVSQ